MDATHIILSGLVFPWIEKAPYVMSGYSVLGGLEYNQAEEVVKCHECGEWFKELGTHVYRTHGLRAVAYKQERGLSNRSSLAAIGSRKLRAKNLRTRGLVGNGGFKVGHPQYGTTRYSPEVRNLRGACLAQLQHRARQLLIQLGRVPTAADFRAAGLHHAVIKNAFGVSLRQFLLSLGMPPRPRGVRASARLNQSGAA